MNSKKIAEKIFNKDTCYGMFDTTIPTDEELIEYFSTWIDEYAKDYHTKQSVVDADEKIIEEKKASQWWN